MLTKNRLLSLTAICLSFILAASACSGTPASAPTAAPTAALTAASTAGVIQGVVYNDLNGNGQIDPGEKPLEGVSVSVSGCGSDQTVLTVADGVFEFTGLTSSSSCTILAIRSGWTFSGSYPSLGYPLVVPLSAGRGAVVSLYLAPAQSAVAASPVSVMPTPLSTPAPTETPLVPPVPLATNTPLVIPSGSAPTVTSENLNLNCLYGPTDGYDTVGVLEKGLTVPIQATNTDGTWWEINNPYNPTTTCWVSGAVTQTSGDTSQLPKLSAPTGLVSKIHVSTNDTIVHGTCGTGNPATLTGTITTNGPAYVVFHWEIQSPGGLNNHALPDQILTFPYYTTLTVTQDFSRDCGDYVGLLVITSPNSKTGQTSWRVTSP